MSGTFPARIVSFLLFATGVAFCQQTASRGASTLPDAPSVQAPNQSQILREYADTVRLPGHMAVAALAPAYDPGHFATEETARAEAEQREPIAPYLWKPSILRSGHSCCAITDGSLVSRATYAATSVFLNRDDEGRRKLNTSYLLRVLTMATAHVAERPYWRRSVSQPFSDFGSTVGNDAGMNVLHQFQPGLLQLVKSHEPRFVSKIEAHARR